MKRSAGLFATAAFALCVAPLTVAAAQVRSATAAQGTAHPAVAGFLAEVQAGAIIEAAARISRIGDFQPFDWSPVSVETTREQLAALLASCELKAADFRGRALIPIHDTEWDCPDGKRYHVQFLPEDANFVDETVTRPYLFVTIFETAEMREQREARRAAQVAARGPIPPPIMIISQESQNDLHARRQREEQAAIGYRDRIGAAFVRGDVEAITAYVTAETEVRYSTLDIFFDVSLEHQRALGFSGLTTIIRRALNELGTPVSAHCSQPNRPHAPHVCRWQLANRDNGLYAEMNFRGPNGMLSSIRFFRETPAEREALRQRAVRAGVTNG